MKTDLVLFMLLLCSCAFAQEQPSPDRTKADKPIVIQNGDFTISVKTDKQIVADQQLGALAELIIARLKERVKNGGVAVDCDLFVSVDPIINETTKKLKRIVSLGVGASKYYNPFFTYTAYDLSGVSDDERAKNIDTILSRVSFQCQPPPK